MKKDKILRTIASNIRQAREASGLTQEGLGELVGVHWKTIGYLETGKHNVGVSMVARIILALKVPCEQIFAGIKPQGDERHQSMVRKATARKRQTKKIS